MGAQDRLPLVQKLLAAIGLSPEAIDGIVDRILHWLPTQDEPVAGVNAYPFHLRDDFLSPAEAAEAKPAKPSK